MDGLTNGMKDDVAWCIIYVDDAIVLIDESSNRVGQKLELWISTELKGFRLRS